MTDKGEKNNKPEDNEAHGSEIEEKVIKATGEVQIRKYSKGRLLGKGGFAKCYEFSCNENNKKYAAKVIAKSSLLKSRAKQKLISEIKIHKSLHHIQIVAFEHYFEDTENVYILLELCSNQTLNELLKRRKRLTEIEVQCYLVQLIMALKYLHSHKVIHRDLKLGNLFLSEKMEIKVGDFGLATKLDFDGERKRTVCGTPNYIAPEILDGKTGHSFEVDIWSLGVILFTLIIGKPPFETQDVKTTYKRIKKIEYSFPENAVISEPAKVLIREILIADPSKRPSLDQILTSDFFNQGISIPKLLPTSTLACTPSLSYIRQFMPQAGSDGIVIRPVSINNNNNNNIVGNDKDKLANDNNVLSGVYSKTSSELGNGTRVHRVAAEKDNNDKIDSNGDPNLKSPETWVKKWIDYSSKYGLGYLLNNGSTGVFFNDSTKIILDVLGNLFHYIEKRGNDRMEIITSYSLTEYPKELHKKVTLLHHFKSYLNSESKDNTMPKPLAEQIEDPNIGNTGQQGIQLSEEEINQQKKGLIYVKKWMKTRHAIMFRLSNKIVQVCFQDHTEIILSSESKGVTYVNKKGERSSYPLATALEYNNSEMTKRLKYTKDILTVMINAQQQQQEINTNKTGQSTKDSINNNLEK